ncbi:MAG: hypothetical protein C4538_06670 [Nitrospiraceae bacterium]|nr:MAG: hypothetical protein C4538_06670 [Nitrospiraceae bacterium]
MKRITIIVSITLFSAACFLLSHASEETKILLIDTNASCITADCHAKMGKKKYIHSIGLDPVRCTRCHKIAREGEHRFKEISQITLPLCIECHGEKSTLPPDIKGNPPKIILENRDLIQHAPFAEGKCTTCHDAHESDYYRHLKAPYPDAPYVSYASGTYGLCINTQCHQNFENSLTSPRTLTETKYRNGNLNLHFKHVNKKKGRTCRTCHEHHGSKSKKLVAETFKFGTRTLSTEFEITDTGGTCKTACHRTAQYDRYEPVVNIIKSSPTPGSEATPEELKVSRERDLLEEQKKETPEHKSQPIQAQPDSQTKKKE